MLDFIVGILAIIAISYHATCILLNRNELKRLNDLLSRENPPQIEKPMLKRKGRRTARFTDKSAKWLAGKGKKDKEVD